MKYRIEQYRPDFVTGFENKIVEFDTMDQFLEIDFVKCFSMPSLFKVESKGFFVAEDIPFIFHIMQSRDERKAQWCVAKILEGPVDELRKEFYDKWKLKSIRKD